MDGVVSWLPESQHVGTMLVFVKNGTWISFQTHLDCFVTTVFVQNRSNESMRVLLFIWIVLNESCTCISAFCWSTFIVFMLWPSFDSFEMHHEVTPWLRVNIFSMRFWPVVQFCTDFTSNSRNVVRDSFKLSCLVNEPVRIVTARGREMQTFSEGDWSEWITLIEISSILCINLWSVTTTRTNFCSVVLFGSSSLTAGYSYPFSGVTDRILYTKYTRLATDENEPNSQIIRQSVCSAVCATSLRLANKSGQTTDIIQRIVGPKLFQVLQKLPLTVFVLVADFNWVVV